MVGKQIESTTRQRKFFGKIAPLFWWVDKGNVQELGLESIVEGVFNYGTEEEIKELLELFGEETVARVFFEKAFNKRSNYFPIVKNFFTLYFRRHVPKHSH